MIGHTIVLEGLGLNFKTSVLERIAKLYPKALILPSDSSYFMETKWKDYSDCELRAFTRVQQWWVLEKSPTYIPLVIMDRGPLNHAAWANVYGKDFVSTLGKHAFLNPEKKTTFLLVHTNTELVDYLLASEEDDSVRLKEFQNYEQYFDMQYKYKKWFDLAKEPYIYCPISSTDADAEIERLEHILCNAIDKHIQL